MTKTKTGELARIVVGAASMLAMHLAPAHAGPAVAAATEEPAVAADPVAGPPPATETPAPATPPVPTHGITLTALAGSSIPINGVNYNAGIGVKAGIHFGHVYVGGMLAVHQGDTKSINWGAVPALGYQAGTQTYSSVPIVTAADLGYRIDIPIAGLQTSLMPYVSAGLIATFMSSSGVYGDSSIVNTDPVIGGGLAVSVPIGSRLALGLHSRTYNVGDTSFHFGNASQGTYEHGFSTSIFYTAFYSELSYTF
jgi:hypothetical protein